MQAVDRDTKGSQRRAVSTREDIVGMPPQRVRDPCLAATILMIQFVRTGSPLTATEWSRILGFLETPLEIDRISAPFEGA